MERRVGLQLVTLRTANTGRYSLPGADQEIVGGDDSVYMWEQSPQRCPRAYTENF